MVDYCADCELPEGDECVNCLLCLCFCECEEDWEEEDD